MHSSPFTGQRSTQAAHEGAASHLPGASASAAPTPEASAPSTGPTAAAQPADEAPFVKAYRQDVVEGALAEYLAKSKDAAPLVERHVSRGEPSRIDGQRLTPYSRPSSSPSLPQASSIS